MKTPTPPIQWTILAAATEFGCSRETIMKGLRTNGFEPDENSRYTTIQIHTALAGDLKLERTRRERAEADKVERENREKAGELMEIQACEKKLWSDLLAPIKQELEQMAKILAPILCPNDYAGAERILSQWAEKLKLKLREPK